MTAAAGEGTADAHFLYAGCFDGFGLVIADVVVAMGEDFSCFRMQDVFCQVTTCDAFPQWFDGFGAVHDGTYNEAFFGAAVQFTHNDVLCDVDETAGQIPGVGGTKRGIGQPFAGTMGRNEVFQHGQPFAEVCLDRHFDGFTGWVSHEAAHPGELTDLLVVTTSPGGRHHVDGVELIEVGQKGVADVIGALGPDFDNEFVAFVVGDETTTEFGFNAVHLGFCVIEQGLLAFRNDHVHVADGDPGLGGIFEPLCLDAVEHLCGAAGAIGAEAIVNDVAEFFLADDVIDEWHFFRDWVVKDDAADGGFNDVAVVHAHVNWRLQMDGAGIIGELRFGW